jgi:hypothetical protein
MRSACLPLHPAVAYLFLVRCMLRVVILFAFLAGATLRAETVAGPEPPPCNYAAFPRNHAVTVRGVLSFTRYGGGRSANAPKWTTAYILFSLHGTCSFEVRAPKSIDLAKYDGYVVDVQGTIKDNGVADLYALTVDRIRRLRHYDG